MKCNGARVKSRASVTGCVLSTLLNEAIDLNLKFGTPKLGEAVNVASEMHFNACAA